MSSPTLATARRIGLDGLFPRHAPQRRRDLTFALIIARLLDPAAKLATARMLDPATASHSLAETLGLGAVPVREVYAALDWLGSEQDFIENCLARRHLKEGALVLYDVTSTYLERRLANSPGTNTAATTRRPAATDHRIVVRLRRLSRRGRGVRGQHRRCRHAGGADGQTERPPASNGSASPWSATAA